jgi:hypothetical protein
MDTSDGAVDAVTDRVESRSGCATDGNNDKMRRDAVERTPMKKSVIVFVALVTLSAAACGGDRGPSTPTSPSSPVPPAPAPAPTPTPAPGPAPTPTPPPSGPFSQTFTGTVGHEDGEGWYTFHELAVPRDGAATFTLTWSNAAVDLELVLTDAACTYAYAKSCTLYAETDTPKTTVERITRTVKAGELYRVWVTNFGDADQVYRLDVDVR